MKRRLRRFLAFLFCVLCLIAAIPIGLREFRPLSEAEYRERLVGKDRVEVEESLGKGFVRVRGFGTNRPIYKEERWETAEGKFVISYRWDDDVLAAWNEDRHAIVCDLDFIPSATREDAQARLLRFVGYFLPVFSAAAVACIVVAGVACIFASSLKAVYGRHWLWWQLILVGLFLIIGGPFLITLPFY